MSDSPPVLEASDQLERLFRPSAIAIVGASTKPGSLSNRLMERLAASRYAGVVYPINPTAGEVAGFAAFARLEDLPVAPDVVLMMRPEKHALAELQTAVDLGVPFVLLFNALGGDYAQFTRSVRSIVAGSRTRVLGPNSMGIQNYAADVPLTFSAPPLGFAAELSIKKDDAQPGIAVIGHSGGVSQSISAEIAAMGALVTQMVSLGNESDLQAADFLEAFVTDPAVGVVVAYLEQIRSPRRFLAAARALRRAGKRLVVLRAGTSAVARTIAASHTGALIGSLGSERAALKGAGVTLAASTREAAQIASVLLFGARRGAGDGLAIITISGGLSGVMADLAESYGLPLPPLDGDLAARINGALSGTGLSDANVLNPLDLGAPGLQDEEFLLGTVRDVLSRPEYGAGILLVSETMVERSAKAVEIARSLGKVLALFVFKKDLQPFRGLMAQGVPVFGAEDEAIRALAALMATDEPSELISVDGVVVPPVDLTEHRLKEWLSRAGVDTPGGIEIGGDADAGALAHLEAPFVLKVSGDDILHKSEVGGVTLALASAAEVVAERDLMQQRLRSHGIDAERFRVEEQIGSATPDFLVGVTVDDDFGPLLTFGLGGIAVEALAHVVSAPAPLSAAGARALVESLPAWRVLTARGLLDEIAASRMTELIRTVGELAAASDWLAELDLNPVVVTPSQRVVVLDAAARRREPQAPHTSTEEKK